MDIIGPERVVWRFDPLLLTTEITEETLLTSIDRIGEALSGYTQKPVISFADTVNYRKVKRNLAEAEIQWINWNEDRMISFAAVLQAMIRPRGMTVASCSETIDLSSCGINHNHCIDEDLIIRLAYKDSVLMNYLQTTILRKEEVPPGMMNQALSLPDGSYAIKAKTSTKANLTFYKDPGQRKACGCTRAKDIGEYDTCLHQCRYCYACESYQRVLKNWHKHLTYRLSPSLKGDWCNSN